MENELKACPFCGTQPKLNDKRHWQSPPFDVKCTGCQAEQWAYHSPEEAIKAWNTRVSAPLELDSTAAQRLSNYLSAYKNEMTLNDKEVIHSLHVASGYHELRTSDIEACIAALTQHTKG